jgi:hypothetical protein
MLLSRAASVAEVPRGQYMAAAAYALATGSLVTVASAGRDGPLLGSLDPATAAELAWDYLTSQAAFLALAESLVNGAVVAAEGSQPEGSPMQLTLPGLPDAGAIAADLNQAWAQGKIVDSAGEALPAWPGAAQIAYLDSGGALVLRWVKGQPWVWIVVAILVAVAGVAVWDALHNSPYILAAVKTLEGAVGATNWLLANWPWLLGAAVIVAGVPIAIRYIARSREAENELRFAERGGY